MGKDTKIEWCDHTFNPWVGCMKVSPGCQHCYAEELMTRKGRWANTWGPAETTERIKTSLDYWRKPLQWQRQAQAAGKPSRVFCASLADVFEDNLTVAGWRIDLFEELVTNTPWLQWQILTKRPERAKAFFENRPELLTGNIWLGVSVENQEQADKRIPVLLEIPAVIRFLSCEPMLGSINLDPFFWHNGTGFRLDNSPEWVIIGGESGPDARPFYLRWATDLIQQCQAANVPVFMKQLGSNQAQEDPDNWPDTGRFTEDKERGFWGRFTEDKKGGDINEWPKEFQVREFPRL